MTIGDVCNDVAQVWGIPDFTTLPALGKARALIDINMALQQLQDAGEDFYGRESVAIDLVDGTSTYTLTQAVQTVLHPAKLANGTVLRQLTSRGQALQYGQVFRDQLDNDVDKGAPEAYFIESLRNTASYDDVKITVQVFPVPNSVSAGTAQLVLDVIKEPTMFTATDLTSGTAGVFVPHKYIESIFLPLVRWNATGSFLFFAKDKLPRFEDEYLVALQLLGKSDPRRAKPAESRGDALVKQRASQPQSTTGGA